MKFLLEHGANPNSDRVIYAAKKKDNSNILWLLSKYVPIEEKPPSKCCIVIWGELISITIVRSNKIFL